MKRSALCLFALLLSAVPALAQPYTSIFASATVFTGGPIDGTGTAANLAVWTDADTLTTGDAISTGDLTMATGKALKTDTTTAHTFIIQVYDVDGTAYKTFITGTNGNTPDLTIAAPAGGTITVQPSTYKSSDGTSGVTVTSCTGFKSGLCISGTP